jgi:hypothetical protein
MTNSLSDPLCIGDSYALEIKDPYLAQVVRRVEVGEITIDCLYLEQP